MKRQIDSPLYTNEHGEELAAAETDVVEVSDEILYSNALIMKLCKSTIFPYIMKFGRGTCNESSQFYST